MILDTPQDGSVNGMASSWQSALKEAFRHPKDLLQFLQLEHSGFNLGNKNFPMLVPRGFAERMAKQDPQDPLLLQVLPHLDETTQTVTYQPDPLQESEASPIPGLLHKYPSRILLITTQGCAIACRYCFRQHFPYGDHQFNAERLTNILDYIRAHPAVNEVILSGGDPLLLSDQKIEALLNALQSLPQIQTIRFHTRLPIVLPERINPSLLHILTRCTKRLIMVIHTNHTNEFDTQVHQALSSLKSTCFALYAQAVLLKGINDTSDALRQLFETSFGAGAQPYYLHLLDKVSGASRFHVDEAIAKKLMWEVRTQCAGYLLPQLVQEQPQLSAKLPVAPTPFATQAASAMV